MDLYKAIQDLYAEKEKLERVIASLEELQRIQPGVVACFMSGHTGHYAVQDLLQRGARHFFAKPFHMEEMIHTLGQLASGPARCSA